MQQEEQDMITTILSAETAGAWEGQAGYTLAPDVVLLLIQDGTARLLDLGGNFYAISAMGALMLHETLRWGAATAVHRIVVEYNVAVQQVQHDLRVFLDDLQQKRLISRLERSPRQDARTSIATSFVLLPTLRCLHAWTVSVKTRAWSLMTLAYIAVRLFGWPRTLAAWQHYYHAYTAPGEPVNTERVAKAIDGAVRAVAASHPFDVRCKERALCCWGLLRSAGFPAKLVLGVALFPLGSHCWCRLGSLVLSDDEERCEQFTPVLSYE
jgi:hypothetical protein